MAMIGSPNGLGLGCSMQDLIFPSTVHTLCTSMIANGVRLNRGWASFPLRSVTIAFDEIYIADVGWATCSGVY